MTCALSAADLAGVESALRVLLSPLDYPDLNRWRAAAAPLLKTLLGADKASFVLPNRDGLAEAYSDDYDPSDAKSYTGLQPLTHRMSMWERMVALGTFDRAMIWHPYLDEYHESEYYNEFIVRIRAFDMIATAVPLGGTPTGKTVAQLIFHHEWETGPKFGARGLALLRLLNPAFRAGVDTYRRLSPQREQFARTLDSLAEGLQLHDRTGRALHRNAALERLLASDPEAELLRTELDRTAAALTALLRGGADAWESVPAGNVAREVRTATARYRLRGSLVSGDLLGAGGGVLVSVERLTPEPPSEASLRERWGLSKKEARVALLVAEGKSDAEIATLLFISPHTARHHTEQVRLKLGVRSRAEVTARVLRA